MKIEGVIFDVDGLLLDTESIYCEAVKNVTGKDLSPELNFQVLGVTGITAARILVEGLKLDMTPEQYLRLIDENLATILPKCKLFPGAKEIVNKFEAKGIPMALATGSNRVNFEIKTKNHQAFFDKIPIVTSGDDVKAGKPNPEIFLTSMEKMGLTDPSKIVVFEDSPAGIKAANAAGMIAIMVPDKLLPIESALAKFDAKPDLILDSLLDFDPDSTEI